MAKREEVRAKREAVSGNRSRDAADTQHASINHQPPTNLSLNYPITTPPPPGYWTKKVRIWTKKVIPALTLAPLATQFKCYQVAFESRFPIPPKSPLTLSPTAHCKSLVKFKLYQKNAWFGKVWLNLNEKTSAVPAGLAWFAGGRIPGVNRDDRDYLLLILISTKRR
jgi:hypothetical protein